MNKQLDTRTVRASAKDTEHQAGQRRRGGRLGLVGPSISKARRAYLSLGNCFKGLVGRSVIFSDGLVAFGADPSIRPVAPPFEAGADDGGAMLSQGYRLHPVVPHGGHGHIVDEGEAVDIARDLAFFGDPWLGHVAGIQ